MKIKWYSANAWVALGTAALGLAIALGAPITEAQNTAALILIGTLAGFLGARDE